MERLIDFGISEASRMDRLDPGWDKLDLENGRGEFITVLEVNNKHYLVTRGHDKRNKGKIQVNEIAFDSYKDGSLVFYFNTHKDSVCTMMEEKLNSPQVEEVGLDRLLDRIGNVSHVVKLLESEFHRDEELIYPEGYFERKGSYLEGTEDESEIKRVPCEKMMITGLSREIFEELRRSKEHYSGSFYATSRRNDELERENEELRRQIEELKRQNEMQQGGASYR